MGLTVSHAGGGEVGAASGDATAVCDGLVRCACPLLASCVTDQQAIMIHIHIQFRKTCSKRIPSVFLAIFSLLGRLANLKDGRCREPCGCGAVAGGISCGCVVIGHAGQCLLHVVVGCVRRDCEDLSILQSKQAFFASLLPMPQELLCPNQTLHWRLSTPTAIQNSHVLRHQNAADTFGSGQAREGGMGGSGGFILHAGLQKVKICCGWGAVDFTRHSNA